MIDLIAKRLESEDPGSALLAHVGEVKDSYAFSRKIDFAADMLPKSLRPGGHNPINALHGLTSAGLHGESDEECTDIFDLCNAAFEHVFKRLQMDENEDNRFKEAITALQLKVAKQKQPE